MVTESNIFGFIDNSDSNKKKEKLAAKAELKAEQDKIVKLKSFDSSYFRGKKYFEDAGAQNSLVFQAMFRYLKNISNTDNISAWKSKGLYGESIKPPVTSDNSVTPSLNYIGFRLRIKSMFKTR